MIRVLFLNRSLKLQRTGVEQVALFRTRLFQSELYLVPDFLTIEYDPRINAIFEDLQQQGLISAQFSAINLYDYFQNDSSQWHGSVTPQSLQSVPPLQRETFNRDGVLSRVQWLDPVTKQVQRELYLRPDGSPAIIQEFSLDRSANGLKKPRLSSISLLNPQGVITASFSNRDHFIAHWLRELTRDPRQSYVFVCDRHQDYAKALQLLTSNHDRINVGLISVIHAVHTQDACDVRHSPTKSAYREVLESHLHVDSIVVATQQQKDDIQSRYGLKNVTVIPPGCATNDGPPVAAAEDGDGRSGPVLVCVGRFAPEARLELAVRAFYRIVQSLPQARLYFYGQEPEKRRLLQWVQELGLSDSVFVHGYARDVASVYASACLSLLTSGGAGYSLAAQESLAYGCPVAAFDVKYGPQQLIRDNANGLLVRDGDWEELAKRIVVLLNDPTGLARMREQASILGTGVSVKSLAEKWRQVLENVGERLAPKLTTGFAPAADTAKTLGDFRERQASDRPNWKVGCTTPVKGRELYLRSCLMQMHLQTRRPDRHVILFNGENACRHDQRLIDDLIEPWMEIVAIPQAMTTREGSWHALKVLLKHDINLFFKIDSDDLYFRGYIDAIITQIDQLRLSERPHGFCVNLVHQLWVNEQGGGEATIREAHFRQGLGLRSEDQAKGMRVGAPPTYVFDRRVAECLVQYADQPPYVTDRSDDRTWRNILFDHGIVIEQLTTERPVFGYLRHSKNTCNLRSEAKK